MSADLEAELRSVIEAATWTPSKGLRLKRCSSFGAAQGDWHLVVVMVVGGVEEEAFAVRGVTTYRLSKKNCRLARRKAREQNPLKEESAEC